jgi:ABC-2 type transport system permease protein
MKLMDWPFCPLINHYADHPITRNLDAVITKFTSSVDTVKAPGIRKTPLMFTSQLSRTIEAPVRVSVNEVRMNRGQEDFTKSFLPVGYLLEGKFSSLFKNRFLPEAADKLSFVDEGDPAKIIVIADGDLASNVVNPRTGQPQPLGFDPFTKYTFANRDLILNAVAYLADENGLINTRNKEVKIRPLDHDKVNAEKIKWKIINVALPVILVIIYGIVRSYFRKRRFAGF